MHGQTDELRVAGNFSGLPGLLFTPEEEVIVPSRGLIAVSTNKWRRFRRREACECTRSAISLMDRHQQAHKFRRQSDLGPEVQYCRVQLLAIDWGPRTCANFLRPTVPFNRQDNQALHPVLNSEKMRLLRFEFWREMPCDIQTMLTLPFRQVPHQKNSRPQSQDPTSMLHRRLQSLIAVVTTHKQTETLAHNPLLGMGADGT